MRIVRSLIFLHFFIFSIASFGQTRTSVTNGSYNSASTWNCSCVPLNSDNIIISTGDTVVLTRNTSVGNVEIQNNALLDNNGRRISINGNYTVNGIHTGSGDIRMTGFKTTIDGIGQITNDGHIDIRDDSIHLLSGASITKAGPGGNFRIRGARSFINNGSMTLTRNIVGNNVASTFYNASGAYLEAGRVVLNTGVLIASDSGNTINYNRSGNQAIKTPLNLEYYNLTLSGTNNKNVVANLIVKNDLTLESGNFRLLGFNLDIKGDFINSGGIFVESTGIVTFNGNQNQSIIALSQETFFDLTVNTVGNLNAFAPVSVTNDLIIGSSSTLDMNDTGNYQLNVQGDLTNSGTINFHQNELLLDGAVLQNISGAISPYNITINNSSGVQISNGVTSVRNVLDINAGQFNTNDSLLFVSNSSGTAQLADLTGGGSVIGNVTVQRYLNESASAFWYMMGSPVTGSTLADWNNELFMGGFSGSNSTWGPTVYKYDIDSISVGGSYSEGYIAPTNITNSLVPGEGWMVWVGSSPKTTDVTGPFKTGNVNISVPYNSNPTNTTERGWALLGNPYASPVDWSAVTKSNLESNEAYVSKPDGNYWALISDSKFNLNSGEAFWAQGNSSGSGQITFQENDKVVAADAYNLKMVQQPIFSNPLKFELSYGSDTSYMDYSVLRFGGDSNSVDFDRTYGEALKVSNAHGIFPNIATFSNLDSSEMYYNNLNPEDSNWTIPLYVYKYYPEYKNETYTIEFNGIENWVNDNHCLILHDSLNSYTGKLDQSNRDYSWTVYDTTKIKYLYLKHSMPLEVAYYDATCYGNNDGGATINGFGSGSHTYVWADENGTIIKTDNSISGSSSMNNLKAGTYAIVVSGNGVCGSMGATVVISQPEQIIPDFDAPLEVDLNGDSVKFINNSINSNYYNWDFGDGNASIEISPSHKFMAAGEYVVSLKAFQNNDCFGLLSKSISVKDYTNISEIEGDDPIGNIYSFDNQVYINMNLSKKQDVTVQIFDMKGQSVLTRSYQNTDRLKEQILVSNTKGILFVRITSHEKIFSAKVLIH